MDETPRASETTEETAARVKRDLAGIKLSKKKSAETKAKTQAWSDAKKANGGVAPLVQPETDETRRATAEREAAEADHTMAAKEYQRAKQLAEKARKNGQVPVSGIFIGGGDLTALLHLRIRSSAGTISLTHVEQAKR